VPEVLLSLGTIQELRVLEAVHVKDGLAHRVEEGMHFCVRSFACGVAWVSQCPFVESKNRIGLHTLVCVEVVVAAAGQHCQTLLHDADGKEGRSRYETRSVNGARPPSESVIRCVQQFVQKISQEILKYAQCEITKARKNKDTHVPSDSSDPWST
jgi:hypothetical protein